MYADYRLQIHLLQCEQLSFLFLVGMVTNLVDETVLHVQDFFFFKCLDWFWGLSGLLLPGSGGVFYRE
jgi:hypothetical protein